MDAAPSPLAFFLLLLSGWVNRQQQAVIDYLLEENRILRTERGSHRGAGWCSTPLRCPGLAPLWWRPHGWGGRSLHDAEESSTVLAGVPAAAHRAGAAGSNPGGVGPAVRAFRAGDSRLGETSRARRGG